MYQLDISNSNPTTIDSNQVKLEWWPKTVDFLEMGHIWGANLKLSMVEPE